jgi:hypothetical protein
MPCSEQQLRRGALLISTVANDTIQNRPIEPCTNFWSSPDLWITGGVDRTTAREGAEIVINVRVTNGGSQPLSDINVEAWVCDYTAGALPTGQIVPPGRTTGFAPGPLNQGQSTVIRCAPTWVPTHAQAVMNGGHLCLAANVWSDSPADGVELPATGTILPCCNTHHAQRNIALVALTEMRIKQGMRLWGAGGQEGQEVLLEFFPVTDEKLFGEGERDLIEHSPWAGRLDPHLADPDGTKIAIAGREVTGRRALLKLSPTKSRDLELTVELPSRDKPGAIRVFDAVTRDARTDDLVGGARLLVVTAPPEIEKWIAEAAAKESGY